VIERQPFDITPSPALVLPEIQQPANAFDREAELMRSFNEPEDMDIFLRVDAVAAGAAVRGRNQPRGFVITDGLGGYARCTSGFADVHG
jgi:hypothetical protein